MLSELPDIQVPDPLARLCKLSLSNTRVCFSEIVDIIEKDQFLRLFVQDCFKDFLKKGEC